MSVSTRELWLDIMNYRAFDRMPVMHWGGWEETRRRWVSEGLPEDINEFEYLDAQPMRFWLEAEVGLFPIFEEEVFEDTEDYRVYRKFDGVICKEWKGRSCIPHYMEFLLKDASGWPEYKKKLQPDPARIPKDLDARISQAKASGLPISVYTGSPIGWIRNWMGVTHLAYLCYDDRDLLGEMVDTIADLVCWVLDQILPKVQVDVGWGWEDICFRSGPLVSVPILQTCVVPAYRKISAKLRQYGVDLYLVDCDGLIDDLIPLWLESGVNVMFPVEVGVWKADPAAFRRKYGKELRICGGIDKLQIAKGPAAIDAEIARRLPLMKKGGFIPLPDHLIPPDASLENYRYYLDQIRALRF
ncbi:MAG: uroporphyrinogen decarboxylase family protein [Candidatus Latescibacterota bacterium]